MGKTQTSCARAQRNNLIFCFALAMVLVGGIYIYQRMSSKTSATA